MKMNISDLLDDYREDTLITEVSTPLSMKRIEEITMNAAFPPKKPSGVKSAILKVLVAAAMVSLLAVTAIAEEREWKVSDWFRPAVDQKLHEEEKRAELQGENTQPREESWKQTVAENQLAVIDEYGKTVNQSVSKNGATATLMALYGDEYTLTLYFRIEAPEGTVLPDGADYSFNQPGSNAIPITVPAGYKNKYIHYGNPTAMPDEDPTDNKKDFVVSVNLSATDWPPGEWKTWTFHDDAPKKFTLRGLYVDTGYKTVGQEYKRTFETLFIGPFEFDVTHAHEVNRREIDVTGCDYSGHIQEGKHPETGEYAVDIAYTISPIRLDVSPFTVEVETGYTGEYAILDFEIFVKDGTSQKFGMNDFGGGFLDSREEEGHSFHVMKFTSPIDPEQIDYVLIGNLEFGDTLHKIYP